jgi:hypothetical protein
VPLKGFSDCMYFIVLSSFCSGIGFLLNLLSIHVFSRDRQANARPPFCHKLHLLIIVDLY